MNIGHSLTKWNTGFESLSGLENSIFHANKTKVLFLFWNWEPQGKTHCLLLPQVPSGKPLSKPIHFHPDRTTNKHLPYPAGIYLLKVNNRNTRPRCEICSKLTIKTDRRHRSRFGVFIVNFEYISQLVLVFLLLTLSR